MARTKKKKSWIEERLSLVMNTWSIDEIISREHSDDAPAWMARNHRFETDRGLALRGL